VTTKPGYSLKHLTLTIPNRPDAAQAADEITAAFRRMRQRKLWKANVDGGVFVIEATGKPGDWHVHIHAVIHARFFPWEKLHQLWQSVSSGRGVYIQRMPVSAVVNYLLKYITKAEVPEQYVEQLGQALKGRRMFQPFGRWHSISAPPALPAAKCRKCGNDIWWPDSCVPEVNVRGSGSMAGARAAPR
jgi:hypothetical protein